MIEPPGPESPPTPPAESPRRFGTGALVAAILVAAIVGGAVAAGVTTGLLRLQSRTNPQSVDLGSRVTINEDTAAASVAQKVAPAVVSIVTHEATLSHGSGFLVTSDGYIVTNTGVVANATSLAVLLRTDNRRHDARVVDYDCQTGLAVLKLDQVKGLPTLAFADSMALKEGQNLVIVAGQLGDRRSVVRGIASALHRTVTVSDPAGGSGVVQFGDVIVPDAGIDAAVSGAPVLNVGGQVVGVAMAGVAQAEPVGFGLAANDLQPELEQIIQSGSLLVAGLGADFSSLGAGEVAIRGGTAGAVLQTLAAGGAADRAGLREGDVVTHVDDQRVDAGHPLSQLLRARFKPDQRVTVTYSRAGSSSQVQLTLRGEHPACS